MKKILIIFVLILSSLLMATTVSGANYWTHYTENFEDDISGNDPTSNWYTFTDSTWDSFGAVSDSVYRTVNHSYEMDDADGNGEYTYFNWTSDTYDYYETYFKIDNSTHERIYIVPICSIGLIGIELKIFGMGIIEPYVQFVNYTSYGFDNYTISNDTWYKIRFDFNYTTHEIKASLYNNASTPILLTSGWLRSDPEAGYVNYIDSTGIGFFGVNGKDVEIYLDDMQLSEYQLSGRLRDDPNLTANQILLIGLIIIVTGLTVVVYAIDLMNTKKFDLSKLIGMVVIVVLFTVMLGFI